METPAAPPRAHRELKGRRVEIDPARLEELAFQHAGHKGSVVRALRCSYMTFYTRMSESAKLREAFERGLTRAGVKPRKRRKQMFEETVKHEPRIVTEEPDASAERTSLTGACDDDLVIDAIRHGRRTVGDILRFTGLTNARLRRSLDVLEHTCQIKSRYERNLQHFYLASEVWAR